MESGHSTVVKYYGMMCFLGHIELSQNRSNPTAKVRRLSKEEPTSYDCDDQNEGRDMRHNGNTMYLICELIKEDVGQLKQSQ